MRISPFVLLLFSMLGCGSGSDQEKTPAEKTAVATVKKHMTPAQLALGDPVVNSVGMLLVPIPAGTFTMGAGGEAHKVTLTKPFLLGQHEVTQEQYEKLMGKTPSKFKGAQNPVEQVSWTEAVEFCRKLSQLSEEKVAGYVYRLPGRVLYKAPEGLGVGAAGTRYHRRDQTTYDSLFYV